MNNDYYCKVQNRGVTLEPPMEAHKNSPRQPTDALLIDYEIVENELECVEQTATSTNHTQTKRANFELPAENKSKLLLNLSAQKIALKSPTSGTTFNRKPILKNQSNLPEAELTWYSLRNANLKKIKQQQRQQPVPATGTAERELHVPKHFSIAPAQHSNHTTTITTLVLNSSQKQGTRHATIHSVHRRASIASSSTTSSSATPKLRPLRALTQPPVHQRAAANPQTSQQTAHEQVAMQADSSTSPESVLDQVLSAASSLSLRSSSLSSGATEMTQFGTQLYAIKHNNNNNSNGNINNKITAGSDTPAKQHVPKQFENTAAPKTAAVNRLLTPKAATTELNNITLPLLQITSPTYSQASGMATQSLQLPSQLSALEFSEMNSTLRSRTPSPAPSPSIAIRITPDVSGYPDELKCKICGNVLRDPRTLNCLHTFCYQCLADENFKNDASIPFWSQPNGEELNQQLTNAAGEISVASECEFNTPAPTTLRQRGSSLSLMRKKSLEKILVKPKMSSRSSRSSSASRLHAVSSFDEQRRSINCNICNYSTELPIGGLRQLPQNFLLTRKIEAIKIKTGDEIISRIWCSLCVEETSAAYHCTECVLNLCTLCKEAHERQRNTANHIIRSIVELRKARRQKQNLLETDNAKFTLKCSLHPGFEIKAFCTNCLQVACSDCLVLLHKGHKHEPIAKAINYYLKLLHDAVEHSRPLCNYAEHSIERMNEIAKNINRKCDEIQEEVEKYMNQYFEAVEVHRKTLIQQINRARESKIEMVLEQQLDLEKHTSETLEAVRFSQEISEHASDVEILSFLNILLKRFDYCQQFKAPPDPKISDSLHFLPKIRAPSTKSQYEIPLYGIITMQTVEPALCTLQWEGFSQLRLHKRVELVMLSRDADGVSLCHGGLTVTAIVKYKEFNTKYLPVEVSDNRDGTYVIAFTPDAQGNVVLTVTINEKGIKGSPFTFLARTVRPHSGIYHCCAFCSSKGNKMAKCSCEGRMPGYNGCGHGHAGHPGRRHWSCCGNVLENSECNETNKLLNT